MARPEVLAVLDRPFAHRGLHDAEIPENSLPAFERAVAVGLGIELDVRLSADGVPVVHHDATLWRSCGVEGRVGETDSDELAGLRLQGGRGAAAAGAGVPLLADALSAVGGRVPVLLDLKAPGRPAARRRLVEAVAERLRDYPGPAGVVGFDPWVTQAVRARVPSVPVGQTGGVPPAAFDGRAWLQLASRPVDAFWSRRVTRPQFLLFNVDRLPSPAVARLRRELPVVAWTVRTARDYATARAYADSVIVEDEAVALALA